MKHTWQQYWNVILKPIFSSFEILLVLLFIVLAMQRFSQGNWSWAFDNLFIAALLFTLQIAEQLRRQYEAYTKELETLLIYYAPEKQAAAYMKVFKNENYSQIPD